MARYDSFDELQRDLDDAERYGIDPFNAEEAFGLLDEDDVDALTGVTPKRRPAPKRRA